jgi:hypothetical protein
MSALLQEEAENVFVREGVVQKEGGCDRDVCRETIREKALSIKFFRVFCCK